MQKGHSVMSKYAIVILFAWLPTACVVQTERMEGLACWDLDGDAVEDPGEDVNDDGSWNSLDCVGHDGQTGVSPFSYADPVNMGDIYYNGGHVGIGTSTPDGALHTVGGIAIQSPLGGYDASGDAAERSGIIFGANHPGNNAMFWLSPDATNGNAFHIGTGQKYDDANNVIATFSSSGLDISGSIASQALAGSSARINLYGDAGLSGPDAGYSATIYMYDANATTYKSSVAFLRAGLVDDPSTPDVELNRGSLEMYTMTDTTWQSALYLENGNVGVGTTTPMATLDVDGTARLAKYPSEPFPCDTAHDGTIALTSKTKMCICDGSTWRLVKDDSSCQWQL